MGLSYKITPTKKLKDLKAVQDHIKQIKSYEFPLNNKLDYDSRYPNFEELLKSISNSGCIILKTENLEEGKTEFKRTYQISYPEYEFDSDLTVSHNQNVINSIMSITSDIRIMLRIATKLSETCGSLIVWSAYDAYYIKKGKTFEKIWDKIKDDWEFEK